jgi:hypothetical protein
MKKLLLLLLPFFAMAQSPDATQIENILLLNNTKQNSATRVIVQDSITKELKFVLRASLVPQANASTSGTVRTTTAEVNPQVYTIGIVDNKLDAKLNVNQKGALNGVATLNSIGKIPNEQIPAVAISETFPISSEAQMIALSQAEQGDIAIRSDVSKAFILRQSPSSVLGNWSELLTPASTVTSVAGRVGAVILNSTDVGLGNVNNTSDANKPISSAMQTALNSKISGSGITNQLARFTASGAVGNSSIFDNGNVGINQLNPTERLDVVGNGKFSGRLIISNPVALTNTVASGDNFISYISGAKSANIGYNNAIGAFNVIDGDVKTMVHNSGNFSIGNGTVDEGSKLFVVGNGKFSGTVTATSFFQSSDIRLKNIIKRDGDVIYFTWKNKRDNKTHIGYIAQKVRAKNPEQVQKDDKGYLSVNYIEILVEKIRNLEKEIEILKAK